MSVVNDSKSPTFVGISFLAECLMNPLHIQWIVQWGSKRNYPEMRRKLHESFDLWAFCRGHSMIWALYSEVRWGHDQLIQISRDFLIASFNTPITPGRFFSTARLTQTLANLETPSILGFRGRWSCLRFIFSPISCLSDAVPFQCPKNSHFHCSTTYRRGSPRLITNVVISFHTKRTEFRVSIWVGLRCHDWGVDRHEIRFSRPGEISSIWSKKM
jgi:hypothetical protein